MRLQMIYQKVKNMAEENPHRHFNDGATEIINLDKLENETRNILYLGLVVAVLFHAALGAYFAYKHSEVKVLKPLTMELIIRKPRMTKPFEFKKEKVKQRVLVRKMSFETVLPSVGIKLKYLPYLTLGTVTTYEYTSEPDIHGGGYDFFIPERVDIDLNIIRKPSNQISMKEEMITIDDLDTGQYKALIIQDPKNKRNIKGFVYIANLWGTHIDPAYKRALINLSEAINKYTKITAKLDKHLFIDSEKLFETPFVFLSMDSMFDLTDTEAKALGEYLHKGGFIVLDNADPVEEFGPAEASLRWMLRRALGSEANFIPIPNDHPLYHAFFDFDRPPIGSEFTHTWSRKLQEDNEPVFYLEGIWIKGRLVAIYSDKGYSLDWAGEQDNEPQLKMGVNMIVFALTQKGSIAQQKMEIFSDAQ